MIDPSPLSTDDITALRQADRVTFHTNAEGAYLAAWWNSFHGVAVRPTEARLYPQRHAGERCRYVPAEAVAFGYVGDWHAPKVEAYYWGSDQDVLGTIWHLLKAGDRLLIRWTADNNTAVVDAAGLHRDQIHLVVDRLRKRRLRFLVGDKVASDEARMIRRVQSLDVAQ